MYLFHVYLFLYWIWQLFRDFASKSIQYAGTADTEYSVSAQAILPVTAHQFKIENPSNLPSVGSYDLPDGFPLNTEQAMMETAFPKVCCTLAVFRY